MEEDEFGNVSFVGMQRVLVIFDDRPLFCELFSRARDKIKCNSNEDAILVEGYITMVGQGHFLGGWSQLHQRHNGTNMSKLS